MHGARRRLDTPVGRGIQAYNSERRARRSRQTDDRNQGRLRHQPKGATAIRVWGLTVGSGLLSIAGLWNPI